MKNGKWVYDPKPEKKEKKKKKIRSLSVKREAENKIYLQKRKVFLGANPNCQMKLDGCTHRAQDVHHINGRLGRLLIDEQFFQAVCRSCHSKHHS